MFRSGPVDGRPGPRGRLAQPAFAVLLVLVAVAAFTWPVVAIPGTADGLVELFVAWALTVGLLALVGRSLGRARAPGGQLDD
jgi:hypothetical protein